MQDSKDQDENKTAPLWSIDDDTLFYPLGLINLGSESKTVIVTWNEDYLLNFVIKKSKNTTIKKVRIPLPETEIVKSLLVLDLNTLCLMQSGHVYYFSSAKSVHNIEWLNGVHAISAAPTVGFSVLRLMDVDKSLQLVLEIYSDVADLNIQDDGETSVPLIESFKIPNVELDLFHDLWSDEKFILLSLAVNENQLNFLLQVIGCEKSELFANQILHFFCITSSLYVLIPNPQVEHGFSIRLLARYASEIEAIKIMPDIQLCMFVLKCGTLDIWYLSPASCVMKRLKHNIDTEYLSYDFALVGTETPSFYYTTCDYVLQLKLVYNANLDMLTVNEERKEVPGIVACTWVPTIQQLVCLSWNNIFYQIAFDADNIETEDTRETTALKNFDSADLKMKSASLSQLSKQCSDLKKALEAENNKRRLLAVTKSGAVGKYFTLNMKYCLSSESISRKCILPENMGKNEKYIELKLVKNTDHFFMDINESWILHIAVNDHVFVFDAKSFIEKSKQDEDTCIVLPINAVGGPQSLFFPRFQCRLLNFIVDGQTYTCLELPVKILHDYSEKLTRLPQCETYYYKFEKLLQNYKQTDNLPQPNKFQFQRECVLSLQAFEQLKSLFNEAKEVENGIFHLKSQDLTAVYTTETKKLTISSSSELQLFTINMILLNLLRNSISGQMATDSYELLQNAQKCKSNLELISAARIKQPIETGHSRMQFETLQEIYHKLRTNLQLFQITD